MSDNGATWPPPPRARPGSRGPRAPQGAPGLPRPLPPGYEPVHHEPRHTGPRLTDPGRGQDSPWRRIQRLSRPEATGWHPAGPVSYDAGPRDPGGGEFYPPGPYGDSVPQTPEIPGTPEMPENPADPYVGSVPETPESLYGQYEDDDRLVPGFGDYGEAGTQGGREGRRKAARRSAGRAQRPGRSRRRRFRWIAPLAALLVILVPLAVGGAYAYSFYMSKYHPADYSGPGTGYVVVQVPSGASPTSLGPELVKLGVVASARAFVLAAEHSTSPNGLLPGFYGVHQHMKASLAYALLIDPKNLVQVPVTIPEGLRLSQIVAVLGSKSGIAASAYAQVLKNPAQLHLPGYAGGKPEGYLFPATYEVQPHETALGVLTAMVQRFDQETAAVDLPTAARQVHLTEAQVITMASLVQAEGGRLSDYPKIARVIFNRLAQGIPLQLDSTVLYGLNRYGILATDAELGSNSPYNTYRHKGLPPGPIDSPGAAAIQAVLHPASGNWLYFVTVNPKTGETLFTSSQAQFEQFEQELRHNLGQGGTGGVKPSRARGSLTGPKRAAVLGSPIAHSLSPVLHRAAYAALSLDGWTYDAIECDEAGLPGLIASCDSSWAGLSLTMPLKRAVLPLLDRTEPLATEVGGANTVVFADGQRHGCNTDVPGMVAALAEAGVRAPAGATVLGAGATACAALAALRATGLTTAVVQVRDQSRAGDLLAAAGRLGLAVELRPFGSEVRDGDLLVSTVPAGAADFHAERSWVPRARPSAVLDVVYHPWPTPLAEAASRHGAIVVSGFDLLLHQAARQVELMTGLEPAPLEPMRAAGRSALTRRTQAPAR